MEHERMIKNESTSFSQYVLFVYLSKIDRHAVLNAGKEALPFLEKFQLDIYLPSYNIAVEYDGERYHTGEKPEKRDLEKNRICRQNGIYLVRLREHKCGKLKSSSHDIHLEKTWTYDVLEAGVKRVISYILKKIDCSKTIKINIRRDLGRIYDLMDWIDYENSLEVCAPPLAKEWHSKKNGKLRPRNVKPYSNLHVWWQCPSFKSHVWCTSVASRYGSGTKCPYCSNNKIQVGHNDLETCFPEIARQFDSEANGGRQPSEIAAFSNLKFVWKCEKGHQWKAAVQSRTASHTGCPYCAGKKVWRGFNDLASQRPDLVKELDEEKNGNFDPETVTCGSGLYLWWKCQKGHSWKAKISNRTNASNHTGCPYCSGRLAWPGFNDLASQEPEIAAEWDYDENGGIDPSEVTAYSGKKIHWVCLYGHKWTESISNRTRKRYLCPYCSGKRPIAGETDLATLFPQRAAQWCYRYNKRKPEEYTPYSNAIVWWVSSECGHRWKAKIVDRTKRKATGKCPYCTNKRVLRGFNDLESLYPDVASKWHPTKNGNLRAKDFVPGSGKYIWWLESDGTEKFLAIRHMVKKYIKQKGA